MCEQFKLEVPPTNLDRKSESHDDQMVCECSMFYKLSLQLRVKYDQSTGTAFVKFKHDIVLWLQLL